MKRLRHLLLQLHWLLGISAGCVLAVVGLTGALLSYEKAVIDWLNPPSVEPATLPLPLNTVVARALEPRPQARPQSLQIVAAKDSPLRLTLAASAPGQRGESLLIDRYNGQLAPPPRGQAAFRSIMQLHRWLMAGEVGKQVVAASTLALLYLVLSGLYLRWPRRWLSPRAWLAFDPSRRGRGFWWPMHAVLGTWCLLVYLLAAASGLWWSYGWYRNGLQALAGVSVGEPRRAGPAATSIPQLDADAVLQRIDALAPGWQQLRITWPDADGRIEVQLLPADAAHERAFDRLVLAATDAVANPYRVAEPSVKRDDRAEAGRHRLDLVGHHRFAEQPLAQRLLGSIFALHRGSYFGTTGTLVFMLASLAMPLFAVSGWWLYLDRRRRQRARAVAPAVGQSSLVPAWAGSSTPRLP